MKGGFKRGLWPPFISIMPESFSKKAREKKKALKKKEKQLRKEERKAQGKQSEIIRYVDHNGNFTKNKPEHFDQPDDQEVGDK